MKAEAVCTNPNCPTVDAFTNRHQVQLINDIAIRIVGNLRGEGETISSYTDLEGNPLHCQWCNSPLSVERLARGEAQFAVGEVEATDGAKRTLAFNQPDDPLAWMLAGAQYVTRHVRGDHGSTPSFAIDLNESAGPDSTGQNIGRIISEYSHFGSLLWIITERDRNKTTIMTPEDYAG